MTMIEIKHGVLYWNGKRADELPTEQFMQALVEGLIHLADLIHEARKEPEETANEAEVPPKETNQGVA
jgi:hypothetical protein